MSQNNDLYTEVLCVTELRDGYSILRPEFLPALLYPGQNDLHIVCVVNRVWPLNSKSNFE